MKPPRIFANLDFWRGSVIVVLAMVIVFLWNQTNNVIETRDQVLVNLCETKAVLGEGFRQLKALDNAFLLDPTLDPSTKAIVQARLVIYNVMLLEFSKTKPCETVE